MLPDDDRLADKVAQEPVVFMDCTTTEILVVGGSCLVGFFIVGIVIGLGIGRIMVGIIIGLLLGVGGSWLGLMQIQRLRNKYFENWLKEKLFLTKMNWGVTSVTMLTESRRYGRGRR